MGYDPMIPIWLQVANQLKADIITGKMPPGSKLPGGRDLAVQYAINPNTAARIYQELEREGVCETRRGLGTFVTTDLEKIAAIRKEMADALFAHFIKSMNALGISREEAAAMLKEETTNGNA